jgi:hypothetical protein
VSEATTKMHTLASSLRRHSILELVVGLGLLAVSIRCALQAETWHAMLSGVVAGLTLGVAAMTRSNSRLWEREALRRERVAASRESKWEQ